MKIFELNEEALRKGWGGEKQYWFSLDTYEIKEATLAAHMEFPEGMNETEFAASRNYIPYFRVKEIELAKAYIDAVGSNKLKAKLRDVAEENYIEVFWKYFNAYPHLSEGYEEFQNNYLIKSAINWCDEHQIVFEVK